MQVDLVVRARDGDIGAFSDLTAGRTPRLYAAARLILRDDDLASDAVQDALLGAWVDLRGLRDPERFDAWLHRLLVRACYRAAARHRRQDLAVVRLARDDARQVVDHQRVVAVRDQLDRGFQRLSSEQRTVLVLRYYLDLSLQETSNALGIPLGTVQSRLSRATAAMRAALDADERLPEMAAEVAP